MLSSILEDAITRDQNNRQYGFRNLDVKVDQQNLRIVLSALTNCMPPDSLYNPSEIHAIWLILQHNLMRYAKEYFALLEKHAAHGLLEKGELAMMEDRILIDDRKPQIYGSQICRNRSTREWELCQPVDLKNINVRRAEVGLEPLEVYLENWGIVLDSI